MNIPATLSKTGKRYQITGKTERELIAKFKEKVTVGSGVPLS